MMSLSMAFRPSADGSASPASLSLRTKKSLVAGPMGPLTGSSTPVLELRDVSKSFGPVRALAASALSGTVLDACAAPGGKTLILASDLPEGARVIAADRRPRLARTRAAQRKQALAQWIAPDFVLVEPDHWVDGDFRFTLGEASFDIRHAGPAHSPEDLSMLVLPDGVLFTGDLVFAGRIPFLGDADSGIWLAALDRLDDPRARIIVPGHGAASTDAHGALRLTRDYLRDLRVQMRQAVADLLPFDEAYARADWNAWSGLAAFADGHRANAYSVYLEMERESLAPPPS